MDAKEVYKLCKFYVPKYGIDPVLMLGLVEQESSYEDDAARLENAFYHRYTAPDSLATTSEILLACSFGLTQLMGESLKEMKFFEWYWDWYIANKGSKLPGDYPFGQICIVK